MEFDPLARDAPPPRHDLESDSELSEEEEGEQGQAGPERTRSKAFVEPKVQVLGLSKKQATLIVAVGETGESLLVSTCPSLSESGSVLVDGEQEASVHVTAAATVVLLRPSHALSSKLASFPFVAAALLDALSPSSLVVIDEYTPQLYLSKNARPQDDPVRYLASSEHATDPALRRYEAPNFITGLAAALLTAASASTTALPSMALLLPTSKPRPHPHFAAQHPSSAIQARAEPIEAHLAEIVSRQLKKWPGTELPREVESIRERTLTTFLDERRQRDRKNIAELAGSMYV